MFTPRTCSTFTICLILNPVTADARLSLVWICPDRVQSSPQPWTHGIPPHPGTYTSRALLLHRFKPFQLRWTLILATSAQQDYCVLFKFRSSGRKLGKWGLPHAPFSQMLQSCTVYFLLPGNNLTNVPCPVSSLFTGDELVWKQSFHCGQQSKKFSFK